MWLKIIELAVRNLLLNKLRSVLTMLGTILGVSSVISMLAIGEGSKRRAVEQIRQLGAANIIIRSVKPGPEDDAPRPPPAAHRAAASAASCSTACCTSDFERLTATLPTIERAVPIALVRKNCPARPPPDRQRADSGHDPRVPAGQEPGACAAAGS